MNVLLIVSNPNPSSLNHALAERIAATLVDEGHHVDSHDLYAEHFPPVLENDEILRKFSFDQGFVRHSHELREADGIILIYPDWWGMPPAILKGWLDRVFRPGVAYEFDGPEFMPKHKVPLLAGKKAWIITTTNETNPLSQEASTALWRERVFAYVGITNVLFKVFYGVRESTGRERRDWLQEVETLAIRWL